MAYTGEDPPDGAKFTGRIPDMLSDAFADLSGHRIFIAGSPDFVDASAEVARLLGAGQCADLCRALPPAVPGRDSVARAFGSFMTLLCDTTARVA